MLPLKIIVKPDLKYMKIIAIYNKISNGDIIFLKKLHKYTFQAQYFTKWSIAMKLIYF